MAVVPSQRPHRRSLHLPALLTRFVQRFGRSLSTRDRLIVGGLALVAVIAAGLLLRQSLLGGPFIGHRSTFTEGIVASSLADVDPTVERLTHAALLTVSEHGELTGDLAESWKVSDDATTFEFSLRPLVDRSIVVEALNPALPNSPFHGTSVEAFGDRGVRITLNQSLAPFIAEAAKPIIPLGPYVIAERTKDHVTLVSRPTYVLGASKLATITLAIFPNSEQLQGALDRRAVDAVADVTGDLTLPGSLTRYTLAVPRTTAAFFNLARPVVQDLGLRQQLIDRKPFGTPVELTVVTTETLAATDDVQTLLADWRAANLQLTVVILSSAELPARLASRDYDVLIDGIDLGADPDPYPFWHSSQRKATGFNLANFANVDADKLLETARTTGRADERRSAYEQFNRILDQQLPWLVLNHAPVTFAADRNFIGPTSHAGFTPTDRYLNVQGWHWR